MSIRPKGSRSVEPAATPSISNSGTCRVPWIFELARNRHIRACDWCGMGDSHEERLAELLDDIQDGWS